MKSFKYTGKMYNGYPYGHHLDSIISIFHISFYLSIRYASFNLSYFFLTFK